MPRQEDSDAMNRIIQWTEIGNKCLCLADEVLCADGAANIESVVLARALVDIAIALDTHRLRWEGEKRPART
jgi:hypothetical protein